MSDDPTESTWETKIATWAERLAAGELDLDWRTAAIELATAAAELLAFLDKSRRPGRMSEEDVDRVRRATTSDVRVAVAKVWRFAERES